VPTSRTSPHVIGPRTADADLSSTLFALGALGIAGVPASDPAIVKALVFVQRCQNYSEGTQTAFDDGGFYFTPTDPVRNKAGSPGTDSTGRPRFYSYGSTTADGLRALVRCGLTPGHPRVQAARTWLEKHFSTTTNPGTFEPVREGEREATYYYYCWSLAHAFRSLGVVRIERDGRTIDWAGELSHALIGRQREDGTWINRFSASKEDDPLIATPFAAGAIGLCRALSQSS
jgi:squalene-hopene/tetraprenyl-beta-curcumene cyclase